ncbi:MAG: heterodisulfide reductase-related iron-sulfur binding cluster [Bacteriovoracaceae bacterium]
MIDDQTTREIMWNIPVWMKFSMYGLLIASFAYSIQGLLQKYKFVVGDKSFKDLLPKKLNWSNFINTIFFTGKVTRDSRVGIFHSMIYYGFVILWIATDLVAIHYDTPFKVFTGMTYVTVSFLADIAGVVLLIGIGLAYKRRYIDKPKYLEATKPERELFMYGVLVALVVIGYLLEGLRIAGTSMPGHEAYISPVGWAVALCVNTLGLSESGLAITYQGLWFFHMANTMFFVAAIGHSKFSHILFLPLSSLITPYRRGAVLDTMDFTDENAESFGLSKFSELTLKNKFDLLTCVECGRCTQVCPANIAGKPLDPKKIITKLRDQSHESLNEETKDFEIWGEESPLYTSSEIDACTTCGACMEECPANIEHVNVIMEAKRYKALTLGDLPPAAADAVNKIKVNGNPWGISQDDRFKWADGLDVPVAEPGKKIDYLYYVGCAGAYDDSNQKVLIDTISLLQKAGVDFAVIGKGEKCNGDPIRRFGDEYTFSEVAIENISMINNYEFDKIITHCPHCLHTIGKEYKKVGKEYGKVYLEEEINADFTVIHHTEILAELLRSGKLKPEKEVNETLSFHDPCYLGRHHGEYDAPREILGAIPGLKLNEMEKNKDKALCCGMGGGNMWYELPEGEHISKSRLEHVADTEVKKLATSCSYCLINFNSSKSQVKITEELEVEDVATLLAKSTL